jgi:sec-independent protein translocase protein TatA
MLRAMANFRGWEWIIILALALLLFGGFKKMPDAARGLGRSLRIFKAETKGLTDDSGDEDSAQPSQAVGVTAAPKSVESAAPSSVADPRSEATPVPTQSASPAPPA